MTVVKLKTVGTYVLGWPVYLEEGIIIPPIPPIDRPVDTFLIGNTFLLFFFVNEMFPFESEVQ